MVPYHRPIPEQKQRGKAESSFLDAWVQAEKMIQIALVLPCGGFLGWLIGAGLDHVLHQSWIAIAGIVVGIVAGLFAAIEMAIVYGGDSKKEGKKGSGTEKGSSGNPS
jgi:F0F1-type ATP synthase assembly protein I